MVFKFVVLSALVACANAGVLVSGPQIAAAPVAYAAPIAKAVVTKTVDAEYDPHPQYSYSYDVQDQLTGDFKSQSETRDGDVVQGQYSLLEADGTRRIVDYAADPLNGFNAVVRKEPAAVAVKAVAAAPVVAAAAPAVVKTVAHAPVAYAAAPAVASYAGPALAYKSYAAAPAIASYAAPALAYKSYAAGPAFAAPAAYAAAPAFGAYAAQPAYGAYAAPAFAKTFF